MLPARREGVQGERGGRGDRAAGPETYGAYALCPAPFPRDPRPVYIVLVGSRRGGRAARRYHRPRRGSAQRVRTGVPYRGLSVDFTFSFAAWRGVAQARRGVLPQPLRIYGFAETAGPSAQHLPDAGLHGLCRRRACGHPVRPGEADECRRWWVSFPACSPIESIE